MKELVIRAYRESDQDARSRAMAGVWSSDVPERPQEGHLL